SVPDQNFLERDRSHSVQHGRFLELLSGRTAMGFLRAELEQSRSRLRFFERGWGNSVPPRDLANVMFAPLRAFHAAHGHTEVPPTHREPPGLGKWVARQRTAI